MATHTATRTRTRSRRFRAILAGGLVLGLGAIVTLASWNASEFATGTFASSQFNVEGSLNGSTYLAHPSAPGAALAFSVPALNLAPGDVVYAPFAIRLAANTSRTATVTITATTGGTVTGLTYSLLAPSTFGCTSGTTGTSLVAPGSALGAAPGSPTFNLGVGAPTSSPGAPEFLCFVVTAGALTQNQTGTGTWEFVVSSV